MTEAMREESDPLHARPPWRPWPRGYFLAIRVMTVTAVGPVPCQLQAMNVPAKNVQAKNVQAKNVRAMNAVSPVAGCPAATPL